jgi:hypothetical protein
MDDERWSASVEWIGLHVRWWCLLGSQSSLCACLLVANAAREVMMSSLVCVVARSSRRLVERSPRRWQDAIKAVAGGGGGARSVKVDTVERRWHGCEDSRVLGT